MTTEQQPPIRDEDMIGALQDDLLDALKAPESPEADDDGACRPRLVDIGVIVSMLADRVPALCAELLPAGAREGHHWRIGNLAGEPGRSMGVNLATGLWRDWGDGEKGGDALDLVAKVLFRGDKRRAIQWARAWLGLDSADPASFESGFCGAGATSQASPMLTR